MQKFLIMMIMLLSIGCSVSFSNFITKDKELIEDKSKDANISDNMKLLIDKNINFTLKLDTLGHTSLINDIIVTKDKKIITASDDKSIRVWNLKGEEERKILGNIGDGLEGMIFAIALSPDEKYLAAGGYLNNNGDSEYGNIRIYHYKTGKLIKVLKSHESLITDLAFDEDGKYLISASADKTAKIWEVSPPIEFGVTKINELFFKLNDTIKFHSAEVYGAKLIKNLNEYFAITAGYDNKIALYSLKKKEIVSFDEKSYKLQFLATSNNNIALSGDSSEITIYDYNLTKLTTITSKTISKGLAYSQDGNYLVSGSGTQPFNVNIYQKDKNFQKIISFNEHKNMVTAVNFIDDDKIVSAGVFDNEIYIWDKSSQKIETKIVGVGEKVWSVGINKNKIAWGNEMKNIRNEYKLEKSLNLKTMQIEALSKNDKNSTNRFNPIPIKKDNYTLSLKPGENNRVLEIKKNNDVFTQIKKNSTNGLKHMCFGFYNDYVISGGADGKLIIYDLNGKEIASLVGHTGIIWSIALYENKLISGSSDQTIKIWDLSRLAHISKNLKIDENLLKQYQKMATEQTNREWSIKEIEEFLDAKSIKYYLTPSLEAELNIFVNKDDQWVMWTNEGFFNASINGAKHIGYYINQGINKEAKFITVDKFSYKTYYKKDLIGKIFNKRFSISSS